MYYDVKKFCLSRKELKQFEMVFQSEVLPLFKMNQ